MHMVGNEAIFYSYCNELWVYFLSIQETQGVTVATFGPNKDFPAFFTPNSGVKSPVNVVDAKEAAELIGL